MSDSAGNKIEIAVDAAFFRDAAAREGEGTVIPSAVGGLAENTLEIVETQGPVTSALIPVVTNGFHGYATRDCRAITPTC